MSESPAVKNTSPRRSRSISSSTSIRKRAKSRWWAWLLVLTLLLSLVFLVAWIALAKLNRTPRELAPYVQKRSSGHNPVIERLGRWASTTLLNLDSGTGRAIALPPVIIGAQPTSLAADRNARQGHIVLVNNVVEVASAIARANAGDVITLMPGHYLFTDTNALRLARPGTATQRIIVRAEQPGTVFFEFRLAEGMIVSAPYWTVENLQIRGVCTVQEWCEHAFHIIGDAHHFIARNNSVTDFNAHFKINMANGFAPDDGLLQNNTLSNSSARHTSHPVTLIDLVAASRWTIERNRISDFVKAGGDGISYGAFVKGAGADNKLLQNIVLCEQQLRGLPGQRVGLSLGGGGSDPQYCRDKRCVTEQDRGVIASNLIAACSDNGIYLNRAAASQIHHNTLLETGGLLARFPQTSADVSANLIDGAIIVREDAVVREGGTDGGKPVVNAVGNAVGNIATTVSGLYLGLHPVRRLFSPTDILDFQWQKAPPRVSVSGDTSTDLCGVQRPPTYAFGAFEDFSACLRR